MESQPNQALELKTKLKQLNVKKGKLSREIGTLKKLGHSIDGILIDMKNTSAEIKSLEKTLKEIKEKQIDEPATIDDESYFPEHITTPPVLSANHRPFQVRKLIDDSSSCKWDSYVTQHPASCAYHRYQFKKIIENSFAHATCYFAAFDESDGIVGIFPLVHTKSKLFGNYLTSMPYFNYGGPLADNARIETQLIHYAKEYASQQDATHIESRESQQRTKTPVKTDKISMFLALPEHPDRLWQAIGTKVRAQIKKGQKNDFSFKVGGADLLNAFYKVFSTNMRDLGTPVYGKSFFSDLLSNLKGNAHLCVLYHGSKPVSCAFLIGHKDTLEIPWASTLRTANSKNANMVLYWNVLRFSIEQKYHFFDFGRSSKDASTYKFKKQWGAKQAPLYWHYWLKDDSELPQLNPNNPKYAFVIWLWKKLPILVTTIIGPLLARSLP